MNHLSAEFKHDVLAVASRLVPIMRGCFYEVGPDHEPAGHQVLGGDTRWIEPYQETYRLYDPFHPRHFLETTRAVVTLNDLPVAGRADLASTYVREFMQPIGIKYKVEIFLRNQANRIVAGLRLGRDEQMGDFSSDMLSALDHFGAVVRKACAAGSVAGLASSSGFEHYTEREIQVLECLLEAMPDKLIARQLDISLSTVKLHIRNLLRKAELKSRSELIVMAYRSGFR